MNEKELLQGVRLFLFDMDGTLYLGDQLFDFSRALLEKIRARGADYMFMTNNSSKSVTAYMEKLARLGVPARREDFITSAQATVHYLRQHLPAARFYVCGTQSLKEELMENGLAVTDRLADVDAVLMGYDTELTFQKLDDVCRLLLTRDLPYIATHPDSVCPTEYGSVPDCGSVCDMIYNATKKRPLVIGKPQPLMPLLAMAQKGVEKARTAVVGDRLNTDIQCGLNAGCVSILVLTGETTPQILAASPVKPHLIFPSGREILSAL